MANLKMPSVILDRASLGHASMVVKAKFTEAGMDGDSLPNMGMYHRSISNFAQAVRDLLKTGNYGDVFVPNAQLYQSDINNMLRAIDAILGGGSTPSVPTEPPGILSQPKILTVKL